MGRLNLTLNPNEVVAIVRRRGLNFSLAVNSHRLILDVLLPLWMELGRLVLVEVARVL